MKKPSYCPVSLQSTQQPTGLYWNPLHILNVLFEKQQESLTEELDVNVPTMARD
jgi:hypothetical protein